MADVRPFRALRPAPAAAARVAAPPYDVVDVDEARALAAGNPDSFLHVTRPEIDRPETGRPETDLPETGPPGGPDAGRTGPGPGGRPGADPGGRPGADPDAGHAAARRALDGLVARGVLVADDGPTLSVYRQRWGGHVQTGVVACFAVDDYDTGVIRVHEHTRPDKEDDRAAHVDALDAHDEPVFLLAPPHPGVRAVIDEVAAGPPGWDVEADGVRHTVWRVDDPGRVGALVDAFAGVPRLYVADGHHRSAAASRLRAARRARGHAGGADAFLGVVLPADEVRVLPYHRVVAGTATPLGATSGAYPAGPGAPASPRDADALAAALSAAFVVTPAAGPVEPPATPAAPPGQPRERLFGLYAGGRWWTLRPRPGVVDESDLLARLDAAVLQDHALGPVLGVADPRTDPRIAFVGGVRGVGELVRRADACGGAAFAMPPTSVADLLAVADAGEVMPPKSTWFEPKLRSGLFLHPLEG